MPIELHADKTYLLFVATDAVRDDSNLPLAIDFLLDINGIGGICDHMVSECECYVV